MREKEGGGMVRDGELGFVSEGSLGRDGEDL